MQIIIDEHLENLRLDNIIAGLEGYSISRSYAQKLIEQGQITVNNKVVRPSYKTKILDNIKIILPEPQSTDIKAENIPLDIVYEDKDLLVINKAINMVVHPAPGVYSGTLVNAIMFHCGSELSDINGVLRPGIVHRLDKDTSGLIVVAKSNLAHQGLVKQLEDRSLSRLYYALCHGHFKEDYFQISRPIGRHPKNRLKMTSFDSIKANTRFALTEFWQIQKFIFEKQNFALIKAKLETGRTHQIRVHLEFTKHHILGDPVYNPKPNNIFGIKRPLLHAYSLQFKHPINSELMNFEIKLAEDFQSVLSKLSLS